MTVNAVDLARVTIDAPASGARVTSPLTVAGWALNPETPPSGGTGIDGIDVWAFPQAGGSAVFVGAAPYGVDRQDVATQYGPQFRYSGYRLTTSHLWAGEYSWRHTPTTPALLGTVRPPCRPFTWPPDPWSGSINRPAVPPSASRSRSAAGRSIGGSPPAPDRYECALALPLFTADW